jgi:hypothetical protein
VRADAREPGVAERRFRCEVPQRGWARANSDADGDSDSDSNTDPDTDSRTDADAHAARWR